MKKIALILAAVGVLLFGAPSSAQASTSGGGYPPGAPIDFSLSVQVGTPGFIFVATVQGCFPGEVVVFRLNDDNGTIQAQATLCSDTTFSAQATFNAPDLIGPYEVTASLLGPLVPSTLDEPQGFRSAAVQPQAPPPPTNRPLVLTQEILVVAAADNTPGGQIPATGSSGVNTNLMIGGLAVLIGFGFLAVAQVRRRRTTDAAS